MSFITDEQLQALEIAAIESIERHKRMKKAHEDAILKQLESAAIASIERHIRQANLKATHAFLRNVLVGAE